MFLWLSCLQSEDIRELLQMTLEPRGINLVLVRGCSLFCVELSVVSEHLRSADYYWKEVINCQVGENMLGYGFLNSFLRYMVNTALPLHVTWEPLSISHIHAAHPTSCPVSLSPSLVSPSLLSPSLSVYISHAFTETHTFCLLSGDTGKPVLNIFWATTQLSLAYILSTFTLIYWTPIIIFCSACPIKCNCHNPPLKRVYKLHFGDEETAAQQVSKLVVAAQLVRIKGRRKEYPQVQIQGCKAEDLGKVIGCLSGLCWFSAG